MTSSDSKTSTGADPRSIGSPKGTRDFYPEDLLRRRYITEVWRAVSIRHGFEEIDGPTFEHSALYAVKSGEGILGELFQAFSGKAEDEREQVRATGNAPFALRPEFTPTLARMYAARAKQLPKPVRWFCVPNFFRAEKPQRGRLREFMQWNVDVIGGEPDELIAHDAEIIGTLIAAMRFLGLRPEHCRVHFSSRHGIDNLLSALNVDPADRDAWLGLLDEAKKIGPIAYLQRANALPGGVALGRKLSRLLLVEPSETHAETALSTGGEVSRGIRSLGTALDDSGFTGWHRFDLNIVRGLAYYTGTVFELIAEGERALAGGGRYDNLVELFGGPPTPACGYGMGDVVLGNLLDDHDLMPADGAEMMDAIQRTVSGVSLRPEVFVVSGGEEHDHLVQPLLANLRAGIEAGGFDGKPWDAARFDAGSGGVRPMHARTTSKSTRNLKKLLADAERQYARFVAVIHGEEKVQLKDLDSREDVGDFAIDPAASEDADLPQRRPYVGRAILERLNPAEHVDMVPIDTQESVASENVSFQSRYERWIDALRKDIRSSAFNQLGEMIMYYKVYLIVNESRRYADKDDKGRLQISPYLHRLIDRSFIDSQLMIIRRQLDTYPLDGTRSVDSVAALLKDIKKHRHFLTRQNLLEAYKASLNDPEDTYWIKQREEMLDILCGVTDTALRSGDDLVLPKWLNSAELELEKHAKQIKILADKFIAHNAAEESLEVNGSRVKFGVSINEISTATQALVDVALWITNYLLCDGDRQVEPILSTDIFKYMEIPLVANPDNLSKLRDFADEFSHKVKRWEREGHMMSTFSELSK